MDYTLGKRIEEIKKDTRYRIEDFVALLGASKQSYNGWINGNYYPSSEVLIKLLEHFSQYSAEWLLLGKGDKYKSGNKSEVVNEPQANYSNAIIIRKEIKDVLRRMIDNIEDV